jgi:ornithine cyclodeaminase
MLYLNSQHISEIGVDWHRAVKAVEDATRAFAKGDFAQPIKPYLRYREPINRIIAMPAFTGEPFDVAGIKWIASFPHNIKNGIQRAHSVTILNQWDTGKQFAILNTAEVSGIRTAAVTGWITQLWQNARNVDGIKLGMTGFGPIGRHHLNMFSAILGDKLSEVRIYDLRDIDPAGLPSNLPFRITLAKSWQEAFDDTDVFCTCTVSKQAYIDQVPKRGSLQLNVSLRDYVPETMNHVDVMLVDDWDEVNREKTDIEVMHLKLGLRREDTYDCADLINKPEITRFTEDQTVMFNPMGLAIYDMAIAKVYYDMAMELEAGIKLPE